MSSRKRRKAEGAAADDEGDRAGTRPTRWAPLLQFVLKSALPENSFRPRSDQTLLQRKITHSARLQPELRPWGSPTEMGLTELGRVRPLSLARFVLGERGS